MARARQQPEPEVLEGEVEEVVISELPGGNPGSSRTIRVYDKIRGDFTLEIPSECTVTFGYFNPAAASERAGYDVGGRGGMTMKTTCLRIYAGKTSKTPQLAAMLGVDGFRDLSLKLTRLRQRVTIESNFEDDGEGSVDFGRKERRLLQASNEDDVVF